MKCRFTNGKLYAKYYYTKDLATWEEWDAPVFDLIHREEDTLNKDVGVFLPDAPPEGIIDEEMKDEEDEG